VLFQPDRRQEARKPGADDDGIKILGVGVHATIVRPAALNRDQHSVHATLGPGVRGLRSCGKSPRAIRATAASAGDELPLQYFPCNFPGP
jgi:hypothetical protein